MSEHAAPRRPPARDGLVVVDKPAGWTSHDVVGRMRRLARTRKVGHAGTLDPMATGVLVIGVGKATRLLTHLVLADKAYTATMRLGCSTTTDDAEGEPIATADTTHVEDDAIRAAMRELVGDIQQVPSSVSAIKVAGQRAYDLARRGEAVELAARPVTVSRFDPLAVRRVDGFVDVDVVVECSSGTYVRALARDVGAALGVGGHLTALRRTRVGPFDLAEARTLDDLATLDDPVTLSLADAVRQAMPVREVDESEARALSYGKSLPPQGIAGTHGAVGPDGDVIALLQEREGSSRPIVVFTAAG
ncbi:MAG: tRNA pseudouridine(55) synthase TruB [Jatrophihabitans sp.]|uniref:tRNA pseudouridine(55) synthase TruB n=1 Tax=Jatrophihabitans sp. TaxID=1932789 RepID=UPI003F7FBE0C